jgi:hypothetical protein
MTVEDQLKDVRTASGKTLYEVQLKRARATAIALASATVASLIFLVVAFVQKERGDALERELAKAKQELEMCRNPN